MLGRKASGDKEREDDKQSSTTARTKPKRWLLPLVATSVIVALILTNTIASAIYAETHVSSAVEQRLQSQGSANVVVTLPFAPEKFHSMFFQQCCAIAKVKGKKFFIRDASQSQVDRVASQYWVSEVDLWKTR